MIRFVDLETSNVFNGNKPYVFWMDKEQSVNLLYAKRICVLSDERVLSMSMPVNDVFRFVNMQNVLEFADIDVNDFKYKDLRSLYTNHYNSIGTAYGNDYYIHMVYIIAQSTAIGEFHEDFQIETETFEIAADFYAEDENLKINLANFGVELPESIQNAIYDVNVHEEANDDITLNRKYKELLLNYWDIVANRGSYKSLLNSLAWFEYGDIVKIEEIWKHPEIGREMYSRADLNQTLTTAVKATLSKFAKTTYLGLYAAMEKFVMDERGEVVNDHYLVERGFWGEDTPALEALAMRWTREEMSLKMHLLGCFYEAYFMPIHLDLLQSTIEDVVFTNTIKVLSTNNLSRFDFLSNFDSFECNVKDGDVFQLGDVNVQAGDMLKKHYNIDEPGSQITETELYSDEYTCADDWSSGVVLIDKTALSNAVAGDKLNVYVTAISSGTEWPQVYIQYINSSHSWVDFTDTHNFVLTGQTSPCTASITLTRAMLDDISNGLQLIVKGAGYTANRITIMHEPFVDKTPMSNSIESLDEIGDYDDYPVFGVEEEYDKQMALSGETENTPIVNDRLKTFMINNYNGIGVVIPISCVMNGDNDDFVNKEIITAITYNPDDPERTITYKKTLTKHELYHCVDGKICVNFKLLLTREGETVLNLGFYTVGGRSYVRSLHIIVAGDTLCRIHLYKVKSEHRLDINADELDKSKIAGTNDYKAHMIRPFNRYMFSHVRNNNDRLRDYKDYKLPGGGTDWDKKTQFMELAGFHRLYIPAVYYQSNPGQDEPSYYGVRLNYIVIINQACLDWIHDNKIDTYNRLAVFNEATDITACSREFDLHIRKVLVDPDGDPDDPSNVKDKYYTFISCNFDFDPDGTGSQFISIRNAIREAARVGRMPDYSGPAIKVIRNEDGFFPQKHYLEELGVGLKYKTDEWGNLILDDNDNPIYDGLSRGARLEDYTITDKDTVVAIPEAKYNGLLITDVEWVFINKSMVGEEREIKMISTKEPFVGKDVKKALEPGFYDIIFRYKTGNQPHEVRLNSAFLKK